MAIYRVPVLINWPATGGGAPSAGGSPGANVWHMGTSGGGAEASAIAGGLTALKAFYTTLASSSSFPFYRSGTVITVPTVTDVDTNEQTDTTFGQVTTEAYTGVAPPVLQIVLQWRTSSSTRRGRGRTFLGPLASAVVNEDGTPQDNYLARIKTASDVLIAASLASSTWSFGVYGATAPGGGSGGAHTLRGFTGSAVRDSFAILRSRRD